MRLPAWLDAHNEVLRLRNQVSDLMHDFWTMASTKDDLIAALKDELLETQRLVVVLRADNVLLAERCAALIEVCPSDLEELS